MRKCLIMQELHSQSFPCEGDFLENPVSQHLPIISGGLLSATTGDEMLQFVHLSAPILSDGVEFKLSGNEKTMISYLKCTYKLLYPA